MIDHVAHPKKNDLLPRVKGVTPAHMLTQQEFLERSGLSARDFRMLVHRRRLLAIATSPGGWTLYDAADVDRVRLLRNGGGHVSTISGINQHGAVDYSIEDGKKVFDLLQKGVRHDAIFMQTSIHPRVIEAIVVDFARMSRTIVLSKEILDQINELPIDGVTLPVTSGADVLQAIAVALRTQRCQACKKLPRSHQCVGCTRAAIDRTVPPKLAANGI